MKKIVLVMSCLPIIPLWVGCGDDENDYVSILPSFYDITFDTDQLYAGMTVTATAVQSRKGKLLDRTTYDWEVNDTISKHDGLTYDASNGDPTFTFKVPEASKTRPTSITVKFTGKYGISGSNCKIVSTEHAMGLSVVTEPSQIEGKIRLSKTFTVYPNVNQ